MDQATGDSVLKACSLNLGELFPPSRAGPLLLGPPGRCWALVLGRLMPRGWRHSTLSGGVGRVRAHHVWGGGKSDLVCEQHTVKYTKWLVGLWFLGAQSQEGDTKQINTNHLATNSLRLRWVTETGSKKYNCIFDCASRSTITHISKLLSSSEPRFESISLSLSRTTQSLMGQQKRGRSAYTFWDTSSGPGRAVELTLSW